MSVNQLYSTWFQRMRQMRPQERVTRLRNLTWLVVGIHQSRSVQLSKIAGEMPGTAKLLSLTRRLSRFLDNAAVRVREPACAGRWYEPVARGVLERAAQSVGEIRLIADGTKVGFGHQLLMVAVAFRKRAIPIAWTWVKHARGHSSAFKQLALLAYVRSLIPAGIPVSLVGDNEFGAVEVMQQLDAWGWDYTLRQKGNHQVKLDEQSDWQDFGSLIHTPGQSLWWERARLTAHSAYPVNLVAHWETGDKEPWLLATNRPSRQAALSAYRRRMWVDEMFGDLKHHGFDLEDSHLIHFQRLSRLTLAVVLLYVWFLTVGVGSTKNGQRHLVDRKDRRDLSIFRIGWRIISRYLNNSIALPVQLYPCDVTKLSGG